MAVTFEEEEILEGHEDRVWTVEWSPKGARVRMSRPILLPGKTCPGGGGGGDKCLSWMNLSVFWLFMALPSLTGDQLASCSGDRTVRIWVRHRGGPFTCAAVLEDSHSRAIRSISWSPCGTKIATGSFDARTCVWQVSQGEWEVVAVLEGRQSWSSIYPCKRVCLNVCHISGAIMNC